jgi:hypothetical protein
MILLVYQKDIVDNPTITINNLDIKHIRIGLYPVSVSDRVIFIDELVGKFKILKDRDGFQDIIIEGIDNLKNFI